MQSAILDESQAGIKTVGRNINNLRYTDGTTLMAKSEEQLKSLLMRVKEQSEKTCLKLSIQKIKITASGPNTSWQIEGETVETVTDGDCSHEIKTLVPWKKNYDKPRQHIKKQRHHFTNRGSYSQSYVFSSSHVWL